MQVVNSTEFKEILANTSETVVVDFYADWCGPCQMLTPVLESLSSEYEGKIKIVKVDIDASQDLAMQFGVSSIPTMIYFKGGKEVSRSTGFQSADMLKRNFDEQA